MTPQETLMLINAIVQEADAIDQGVSLLISRTLLEDLQAFDNEMSRLI